MGETDATTLGDQHAGVLRLDDRRRYFSVPGKRGQRTAHCRDCRARQRRGHQDRLPRRKRERVDPLHRQLGHPRRHRQWLARACVAGEASCDLDRIKGIAARCIGDPARALAAGLPFRSRSLITWRSAASDSGPTARRSSPSSGSARSRPSGTPATPSAPPGHQQAQPPREPPRHEGERCRRGTIEPLHIIDGEQHRRAFGEHCQHGHKRGRGYPCVGWLIRRGAQQDGGERTLLRIGQGCPDLIERDAGNVGERCIGKP